MDNLQKKWYIITSISGKEKEVIESLKNRVISENVKSNFDLEHGFKVMLVPHIAPQDLEKKKNGHDYKVKTRNLFKGYIFVKLHMTNDIWFLIRNTRYITGIVGSSGQRTKPAPISNAEITKMELKAEQIKKEFNEGKIFLEFKIDQLVEVIKGPTKGQVGKIIEKNDNKQVAIVELILFERKTPTEISYKNLIIKK